MEGLPADLTIDILSRLPVKTIFYCRRVCRKWRNLVSDSSFINLHSSRSPTVFIIHHHSLMYAHLTVFNHPGILKWLEIKDKLDFHHDPSMTINLYHVPILQNCHHMGSVNGLICLWKHNLNCDDTYIWNPVTREIMILPSRPSYRREPFNIVYGFGVNSLNGEYKVVRIFPQNDCFPSRGATEAELYTIGTSQWRSLGQVPYKIDVLNMSYGPFLNDHLHWIVCNENDAFGKICTFDLNKETFQLFPSPPPLSEAIKQSFSYFQSLVVLKGCLCKFEYCSQFTCWVMKEYGIRESWHKEVVIIQEISRWPFLNPVSLIDKVGSILMVNNGILGAFCLLGERIEVKKTFNFSMSGVAYRPSFLKLQNYFESERVHMF